MATENIYTIVEGDCLSVIAKRYNTSVDELKKLNIDEIKNIELIFTGHELKLPSEGENTLPEEFTPADIKIGERTDLVTPPEECAGEKTTCGGVNIDYVDILYVPAHPQTGKKVWYALTQEALDKVKQEQGYMASAITDNEAATLDNLNNLGLLSKFQTKPHDAFFEETIQRDKYRALLTFQTALNVNKDQDAWTEELINKSAMTFGFCYSDKIARKLELAAEQVRLTWRVGTPEEIEQWIASTYDRSRKQISKKILEDLLEFLQDEIEALEKLAEKQAKKLKADDKTHFVYDRQGKYFTSERQKDIAETIQTLVKKRNSFNIDEKNILVKSHEDARSIIKDFWHEQMYLNPQILTFTRALCKLNDYGFVVKEQCLNPHLLEGTDEAHYIPKGLKTGWLESDWREAGWFSLADELTFDQIKAVYDGIGGDKLDPKASEQAKIQSLFTQKSQYSVEWAYYPTKALLTLIDRTLKKDLNALKTLLGQQGVTLPDYFKKILWIKKVALARIEFLKKIAETKAQENAANLLYFSGFHTPLASYTLLWDEDKWKTQPKKLGKFINKAGIADVQPVECFLLSEQGKAIYLRGPWWYMPKPSSSATDPMSVLALKHVKVITTQIPSPSSNGPGDGAVSFAGLMEAVKKGSELSLGTSIAAVMHKNESTFWQDQYHYEGGEGQDGKSGYISNAQAQFLRFTSESTANIGLPTDKVGGLSIDKTFSTGAAVKFGFSLFSAQYTFETWLPLAKDNNGLADAKDPQKAKVTGYPLILDYVTQSDEHKAYYAGDMCFKISVSVYGMAAASINLSAGIELGPSSNNDEIGVRGRAYKEADYNQARSFKKGSVGETQYISGSVPALEGAAQVGVGVNAFAGVEAGGMVKGEVFWRPPMFQYAADQASTQITTNTNVLASLGSITAQASISFGIGGDAAIKLVYDSGCLVLITAAKWACGPGVGGKIAIALNPYNIDAFIGSLLNLLNSSGFKHLRLLGDETGGKSDVMNETFVRLNEQLTLAVSLGLTMADMMLLPFEVLADYKKSVMKEEYAPTIAKHIIKKDEDANKVALKTQAWVQNLPPETLAPLLTCLINAQEYSLIEKWDKWNPPWSDNEDKATQTDTNNQAQLQAVLQILAWITPASSASDEEIQNKCRQFEKTLSIMTKSLGQDAVNYQDKWQSFRVNWLQLAEFVDKYDKPDESGIKYGVINFNNSMKILCKNMCVFSYKKLSHDRNDGTAFKTNKTCFLAYYAGPMLTDEQKKEVEMVKQQIKQYQAQPYLLEI
ncbi:LysM peptidoglycan-binding domain-containing protein [Shewanella surugensis]|uniref:LysM peptidoglycan-binding domain-containing protein n=1 Tax=Shewanella surugensis TaxID=212020 RepID=A0ABT0LDX4_9GAMM|nr:LysM domain-containing protein [Shewanella surugensis]MCL1125532.1 LysM peptidoglycan-binding domain-containing protein [Shewanella surugensis]